MILSLTTTSGLENSQSDVETQPNEYVFEEETTKSCEDIDMQPDEKLVKLAHEIEKSFDCSMCDAKFKTKGNLNKHFSEIHGKKFKCSKCPKSFEGKKRLILHMEAVHEKKKPFQCSICPIKFVTKSHLKLHISTVHDRIKPHKCPTCQAPFGIKSNLKNHISTVHDGIKPHKGQLVPPQLVKNII